MINPTMQLIRFYCGICICLLLYIALSWMLKDQAKYNGYVPANQVGLCNIPKLDPFNPAFMTMKHENPMQCDNRSSYPLIFSTDLENHIIMANLPEKYGYHSCCYRNLFRSKSDFGVQSSSECIQLTARKTRIPVDIEHIAIICTNSSNGNNVTVDAFGFIQLKPDVEARISSIEKIISSPFNVVLLVVDSVSHMQLMRDMPETYNYLTKNLAAIGMNGYVKVGENTFPNMIPVLTGLSRTELEQSCWKSQKEVFDDCPFIWKKFSSKGYRTSYLEDCARIALFNSAKAGFRNPPVDYYLRPLSLFMERNISNNRNICRGPRFSAEILLDQMKKMAWTMKNVGKYFQFAMTVTLTHTRREGAVPLDGMLLKHLNFFNRNGLFNRTLYILMSDHGYRMDDTKNTGQGRIEDRMPFLYFVFPSWFINLYPQAIENLRRNWDKMTTPFDLHETLKDILAILDGNFYSELKDSNIKNVPRGISLFRKVPPNRTCLMAGIDNAYCVCAHMTPITSIKNNTLVKTAANVFIESINQQLIDHKQCLGLSIKRILHAFDVRINDSNYNDHPEQRLQTLMVTVQTSPGGGIFEVTVNRKRGRTLDLMTNSTNIWNLATVSRTNRYGHQSHCVNESELKIYCLCRDPPRLKLSNAY